MQNVTNSTMCKFPEVRDSTTKITEISNIDKHILMEKNQQEIKTTPLESTSSNIIGSILNPSTYDTPTKRNLKTQLLKERSIRKLQAKRIKILMQQNRRCKKRLKDLVTIVLYVYNIIPPGNLKSNILLKELINIFIIKTFCLLAYF
ncbi:uncharacterized protein LOC109862859 [Pseudomyrmex gracilis]|uniref:uncharacterized protein LOC109862859 n=1 Tax=Pseudomyrmex gracilis TaxID=219809 RepID=UPI00099576A0|nr:uncharacterized protein LOC109862859 [Pseudomyrmex gracilis]